MSKIINQKEIKEIFEESAEKSKCLNKRKNFKDFLKFLEIDFYDWFRGNLRSYFRERN